MSVGDTATLTPTVQDAGGTTMSGAAVTWATSAATTAAVSSTGLVTAVAVGTATITATSGSAGATASVTVGLPTVSGTIPITYNVHESLPTAWIEQFAASMQRFIALLPLHTTNYHTVTVYSWNDNITDPYDGISGGSYVGGSSETDLWMVLEIPNAEFANNHLHQYSVIAHEYFHLYQLSINMPMHGVKWLIEGGASVFEAVYTDQYYSPSDQTYFDAKASVEFLADGDPAVLESYASTDSISTFVGYNVDQNYSASTFLVLALVKELMKAGYSEADALKRVLGDFPAQGPTESNWKSVFESLFGFSVDDFYNVVKTSPDYRQVPVTDGVDVNKVRPSRSLTVQSIFN
jgi:hypothetical protein